MTSDFGLLLCRRKREMEVLEKESSTVELRVIELRMTLQNLLAQEEQLRMQQGSIRDHLTAGCKPDQPLPLPAMGAPLQNLLPPSDPEPHPGQEAELPAHEVLPPPVHEEEAPPNPAA
jgi:hypothetical protein